MREEYIYNSLLGNLLIEEDDKFLYKIEFTKEINKQIKKESYIGKQIDEYVIGKRKEFDANVFLEGTEFQKSVWNELLKVQYGQLVSYQDIAKRINKDNACRAVGNACNKNKIIIIIPCHRVIGKNKKLIGFGAGLELKKKLIDIEKNVD